MAGNSTLPKFGIPQSYDVTIAAPLDTRLTTDSDLTSQISVQIPVGIRYAGLLVWLNYRYADIGNPASLRTDGEYMYFRPDYSQLDPFLPANLILTPLIGGAGLGLATFKTTISSIAANTPVQIFHALRTTNLLVTMTSFNIGTGAMKFILPEWVYDDTNINLSDVTNVTNYSINSKYHAIFVSSKVLLNNVTITITARL